MFLLLAWIAIGRTSQIPIVDGWAVLNRLMRLQGGEVDWRTYLLTPHGAHLHSIIYALTYIDFYIADGTQQFTLVCSLVASAALCLIVIAWLLGEFGGILTTMQLILVALGVGAIVGNLADKECMMIPFQAVLTVSRIAYVLLLYAIAWSCMHCRRMHFHLFLLAATVAVTFHGTGVLFAICICLIPWLSRKSWSWYIAALVPLGACICVTKLYSPGPGELAEAAKLRFEAVPDLVLGFAAYFAVPFAPLRPLVGTSVLLALGGSIGILLSVVTVRLVLSFRIDAAGRAMDLEHESGQCRHVVDATVAVFGVLLILSACSASLMWCARFKLLHIPGHAYEPMLGPGNNRYIAYAGLAQLVLLSRIIGGVRDWSPVIQRRVIASVWVLSLGLSLVVSAFALRVNTRDDDLAKAAAALSVGISPIAADAEAVWPGAKDDWYWVNALPKTVDFMKERRKSIWSRLPRMADQLGSYPSRIPLADLSRVDVDAGGGGTRVRIAATISCWGADMHGAAQVLPVVDREGVVVGYACVTRRQGDPSRRSVVGFCTSGLAVGTELFLAPSISNGAVFN